MVDSQLVADLVAAAEQDGVKKFVVGSVIRSDGKFLLVERVADDFMGGLVELPSGTVDPGEDLLTALRRETAEETGLSITSVVKFLDSFDYVSGSGKKTRQFNFVVDVAPGDVKLCPEEHCAHFWVGLGDEAFKTLNISDAVKKVMSNAAGQLQA